MFLFFLVGFFGLYFFVWLFSFVDVGFFFLCGGIVLVIAPFICGFSGLFMLWFFSVWCVLVLFLFFFLCIFWRLGVVGFCKQVWWVFFVC